MLSRNDILETIRMIDQQHLDIRTITMGISLLSCADSSAERACEKIYDKISRYAEHLVATGEEIEREFGIPIVNKRISVTPIALVAAASETEDYVPFAKALDRAAKNVGVNFIGGFSALVQKGMTDADRKLIAAIPEALACTDLVCSSVNVGSSKAGINMDAVALMGQPVKKTAALTEKQGGFGCAKLVIFCNAVEDNPFMAGAFHGVGEADSVVSVGVSGPGVVYHALQKCKGQPFDGVAETIKKTAFQITRMGQMVATEAARRLDTPFGIVDLSSATASYHSAKYVIEQSASLILGVFAFVVMTVLDVDVLADKWQILCAFNVVFLLLLIPFYNIYFAIKMMVDLAKAFNQGVGFAIGLLLLPFVFNLILALGGAQYMDGSFANTQPDMVEDVVNKARDAVSGDQNDR